MTEFSRPLTFTRTTNPREELTVDYKARARADYNDRLGAGYTEPEALASIAALYWVRVATLKSWLDA
jgi:hypothetical protein